MENTYQGQTRVGRISGGSQSKARDKAIREEIEKSRAQTIALDLEIMYRESLGETSTDTPSDDVRTIDELKISYSAHLSRLMFFKALRDKRKASLDEQDSEVQEETK